MAEGDVLTVDVVAADRRVWSGEATSVIARTTDGDLGILVGHQNFLGILVPCAVEILTAGGKREVVAVDGGFLSVANDRVAVLSQFGRLAQEISVADAERELAEAERMLEAGDTDVDVVQHHRRASAQLRAAQKVQHN